MPDSARSPRLPTGTLMAGQARPRHGRGQRPLHRLGHRRAPCAAQGAELAFTYQGEALEKRVRPLAESVGSRRSCCPAT